MATTLEVRTREEWLIEASKAVTPLLVEAGAEVPKFRVSVGFPKSGKNAIGQCWTQGSSADGLNQLFIHPQLGDDIPFMVAVLIHEMIHAADNCENGHKGRFREIARGVGLEGKLTATVPGGSLRARITEALEGHGLGAYPHGVLDTLAGSKAGPKPQKNRQRKVECYTCGYIARVSKKWIDEVGPPMCPDHGQMVVEEVDDDA